MSFYFTIPTKTKTSFKQLSTKIDNTEIRFNNSSNDSEEELIGTKIYIPNKSTRGITISYEDESYSIGINVIASEEDHWLAINTSKAIAFITGGQIIPEDKNTPISAEDLSKEYDQSWIDTIKTSAVNLFIEKIGNDSDTLSIGCCFMQYAVGPRIHSLLDTTNELSYYNSLVKHIQNSQFFDREKYTIPNLIITSNDKGKEIRRLVFYPNGNEFLTTADIVVFPLDDGSYEIPYELLSKISTEKFTLIDENQYVIDTLSDEEFKSIITNLEKELENVDEEALKIKYSDLSQKELDHEFSRIARIPNARTKIFALKDMSILMKEYKKRNLETPSFSDDGKLIPSKTLSNQESNNKNSSSKTSSPQKKPWWKFW